MSISKRMLIHCVLRALASSSRHLMRMTSAVYVTLAAVAVIVVVTVAVDDVVSESREESDLWLALSAAGGDSRDESSSSPRLDTVVDGSPLAPAAPVPTTDHRHTITPIPTSHSGRSTRECANSPKVKLSSR